MSCENRAEGAHRVPYEPISTERLATLLGRIGNHEAVLAVAGIYLKHPQETYTAADMHRHIERLSKTLMTPGSLPRSS